MIRKNIGNKMTDMSKVVLTLSPTDVGYNDVDRSYKFSVTPYLLSNIRKTLLVANTKRLN